MESNECFMHANASLSFSILNAFKEKKIVYSFKLTLKSVFLDVNSNKIIRIIPFCNMSFTQTWQNL